MKGFSMKEIFEKAKRVKISYNINEKTLEMIDEMAGILGVSRSKLLDGMMFVGIWAHTNFSIKEWEHMKKDKEYKDKIQRIEEMIQKIKQFKKKWTIDDIPHY